MNRDVLWHWLTATVWTHLVVSLVHGVAHNGAHVLLSPLQTGFVFLVILAGPLIGLAVARWRSRAGAWIMAVTLGASLVFGVVNHFVVAGPDHVTHVAQAWRPLFAWTAALVGLTESDRFGSGNQRRDVERPFTGRLAEEHNGAVGGRAPRRLVVPACRATLYGPLGGRTQRRRWR